MCYKKWLRRGLYQSQSQINNNWVQIKQVLAQYARTRKHQIDYEVISFKIIVSTASPFIIINATMLTIKVNYNLSNIMEIWYQTLSHIWKLYMWSDMRKVYVYSLGEVSEKLSWKCVFFNCLQMIYKFVTLYDFGWRSNHICLLNTFFPKISEHAPFSTLLFCFCTRKQMLCYYWEVAVITLLATTPG